MDINPLIPMQAQSADLGSAVQSGLGAYRQGQQMQLAQQDAALRNPLIKAQTAQAQGGVELQQEQINSLKNTDAFKSSVYGALQGKQLLDAGDVNGFLQFADQRAKNITDRGGVVDATAQIADLVRNGKIDEAKQRLDSGIQLGKQAGILKPDERNQFSSDFNDAEALLAAQGITQKSPGYAQKMQDTIAKLKASGRAPGEGSLFGTTYRTQDENGDIHAYQLSKTGQPVEIKPPAGQKIAAETPWDQRAADVAAAISKAGGETTAKGNSERDQKFIDTGIDAHDQLTDIQRMKELNALMSHGGIAAAATRSADIFGATPANEGEFRALSKQYVMKVIKQLGSGSGISDSDRQFAVQTQANLSQGGEVNDRILSRMEQIANRSLYRGQQAAKRTGQDWNAIIGEGSANSAASTTQSQQSSAIPEGQTATNPQTGEKIVYRGGQWQKAQ